MDSSVGGPIDVCVISKHDGCVWVKKKQYFSADMNPGFFARKHIAWEELSNAAKTDNCPPTEAATVSLPRVDSGPLLPETDFGSVSPTGDASPGDDESGFGDA